jgi:GxxExxY protein
VVVDCCYKIHVTTGPGLFESVYEAVLKHELEKRGLVVRTQVEVRLVYDGLDFGIAFIADMIVNGLVILELKSLEKVAAIHHKQLLTYLKLTGLKLGLLINFGDKRIKDGITRLANGLPDSTPDHAS